MGHQHLCALAARPVGAAGRALSDAFGLLLLVLVLLAPLLTA